MDPPILYSLMIGDQFELHSVFTIMNTPEKKTCKSLKDVIKMLLFCSVRTIEFPLLGEKTSDSSG